MTQHRLAGSGSRRSLAFGVIFSLRQTKDLLSIPTEVGAATQCWERDRQQCPGQQRTINLSKTLFPPALGGRFARQGEAGGREGSGHYSASPP